MAVFCVEVWQRNGSDARGVGEGIASQLRQAGLERVESVLMSRLFFLEGELSRTIVERAATELLADPVVEDYSVRGTADPAPRLTDGVAFEIHLRPGVTDPVAESTLGELRAEGIPAEMVRTARRYVVKGQVNPAELMGTVGRVLANDCIELVVAGSGRVMASPRPPVFEFKLRSVAIRELSSAALEQLSREGHLFLSLEEMQAIREHYRGLMRDPTDLELETIAQTWSEHCVHKTLKSAVRYRGAAMPGGTPNAERRLPNGGGLEVVELRYSNLLGETIARATRELMAEGRGPECLSVFKDNAGVIGFDEVFGIAFKVETHNHPSAIEPYGGAATGVGGCIRDVIGCGLGARPIANTDVFCVAATDWGESLPRGVLHPGRVLRNIVRGVADYGNRMGIPTVNGAIFFDPRYLGNPLVFCGCVGLIPRDKVEKAARAGDLIVLVGGRTGRDGIHGATFSSAELSDTHADEFSHAVQIGNAITEKRFLDAILRARDEAGGCLYSGVTDCGAGGLSSAIGEMGEETGAVVNLEKVPLKYAGLRYDEIWISEAQERMVLAVPPANVERLMRIMREERVEATVIGEFGSAECGVGNPEAEARRHEGSEARRGNAEPVMTDGEFGEKRAPREMRAIGGPRLITRFEGRVVGDMEMRFLHGGLPKRERVAEWWPGDAPLSEDSATGTGGGCGSVCRMLLEHLARPAIASKEWVIRQYDHEVQGGSVVKPLCGRGTGPSDAAVLRPVLEASNLRETGRGGVAAYRGAAIGCGLAPELSDVDPYWMAVAAVDEAIRNVVCVGGDPRRTAILDNFCWGRCDEPRQMGALVRACQACYDAAQAYGTPFISGKDSLNNEFALDEPDIEPLIGALESQAADDGVAGRELRRILPSFVSGIRRTRRLAIPGTLLISALSLVDDVRRCVTADLKKPNAALFAVGGLPRIGMNLAAAAQIHESVAAAQSEGLVSACHDCSDGGWLVAVAEMSIAGNVGVEIGTWQKEVGGPFEVVNAGYVAEAADANRLERFLAARMVRAVRIGTSGAQARISVEGQSVTIDELRMAWRGDKHCAAD